MASRRETLNFTAVDPVKFLERVVEFRSAVRLCGEGRATGTALDIH
jgi:hypothetical protein